jgi:hypothetical protein
MLTLPNTVRKNAGRFIEAAVNRFPRTHIKAIL